ncbi:MULTISPECIES: hypothetical protein [Methylomicrobium]|uniref:Uncharacterized protein n=1 Tax=Methylomicrobium album BG8 TaxID=686340 RepID=H8GM25_METAL|nr:MULTISPECIES: hypothetical protein [Methylomicrobium]EIC29386.1 hypothetical protein Metal_1607 [Methylomicrobium album BG8]
MKPLTALILAGFLLVTAVLPAGYAGTDTLRVDRRQEKQQQRIEQGVSSGRLTSKEVQRLQAQQEKIRRMEDKAKADGVLTRKEQVRLNRRQNQASQNIYRKKHNLRRQ